MKKFHAISLDFDGCIFHNNYIIENRQRVIDTNFIFLEKLRRQNEQFDDNLLLIGSNRQSKADDRYNSIKVEGLITFNTGSCFIAIKKISKHLGVQFDPFLLADVYGDVQEGEAYRLAMDPRVPDSEHPKWQFDETKVSILYAQMHHIAFEHHDEETEITFDFYDDRQDILDTLKEYFSKYPTLIPSNLQLRLHKYAGQQTRLIEAIKGTGDIDCNFRDTVIDMAKISPVQNGKIRAHAHVTPELLSHRFLIPPETQPNTEMKVDSDVSDVISFSQPGRPGLFKPQTAPKNYGTGVSDTTSPGII